MLTHMHWSWVFWVRGSGKDSSAFPIIAWQVFATGTEKEHMWSHLLLMSLQQPLV